MNYKLFSSKMLLWEVKMLNGDIKRRHSLVECFVVCGAALKLFFFLNVTFILIYKYILIYYKHLISYLYICIHMYQHNEIFFLLIFILYNLRCKRKKIIPWYLYYLRQLFLPLSISLSLSLFISLSFSLVILKCMWNRLKYKATSWRQMV